MKIGIIGAGKLGSSWAIALSKLKGFKISGVFSKSTENQQSLCDFLNICYENTLSAVVDNSELIFITVPDSKIESIAEQISILPIKFDKKYFIHCSGAKTSDILCKIEEFGGITATLHPIQTFSDRETGWTGLNKIYFGFEGKQSAENICIQIVTALNSEMITISKKNKPLYHAAACVLSNYISTLAYIGSDLFEMAEIDPQIGIKAFQPLMKRTLENIFEKSPLESLTGPISRGDWEVVKGHIHEIETNSKDLSIIYKTLGLKTLEIALIKNNLSDYNEEKMRELLQ
jgi:predicted short-subunit dehydrogenase-like oxidoreductase (DUF2520 family)